MDSDEKSDFGYRVSGNAYYLFKNNTILFSVKWIKSVADAEAESPGEKDPFLTRAAFKLHFSIKAQMDYILHSCLQMLQLMTFLLV